jgi:hypothetical protein
MSTHVDTHSSRGRPVEVSVTLIVDIAERKQIFLAGDANTRADLNDSST